MLLLLLPLLLREELSRTAFDMLTPRWLAQKRLLRVVLPLFAVVE